MKKIKKSKSWNDAYSFDIPIIDEQHKKLFHIYDNLSEMINSDKPNDDASIRQILIELEEYTKFHFLTEENLFIKAGVANAEDHIIEHGLFIKKIQDCMHAYEYKNPLLAKNMLNFVKKWLISHILESDIEYKDQMKLYLEANPDYI